MAEDVHPNEQPSSGARDATSNQQNKDSRPQCSRCNNNSSCNYKLNKWKDTSNSNTSVHIPKEKFVGQSDDLKGFIYDVTNSKGGVAYDRTTEEIVWYVNKKYMSTGSYIRTAVLTLNVPTPDGSTPPVATSTIVVVNAINQEIFKGRIRMYVKIADAVVNTAMKSLYDLIWGQCNKVLCSRL